MDAKKIRVILSLVNLLVISVLVFDTFFIPTTEKTVVLKDKYAEKTGSHGTYRNYFLTDEKGNEYNVPRDFYLVLDINEGFIISQTGLFRKTIAINYHLNKPEDKAKIGAINSFGVGIFAVLLGGLLSLLVLFFPNLFKNEKTTLRVGKMASWITLAIIVVYFFIQD